MLKLICRADEIKDWSNKKTMNTESVPVTKKKKFLRIYEKKQQKQQKKNSSSGIS